MKDQNTRWLFIDPKLNNKRKNNKKKNPTFSKFSILLFLREAIRSNQ